ncbi:MAG: hypothetical protein RMY27_28545 [Nostoc sp. DedQUE09]|nr:hypothetical protein [Nostoc sp. DedQUE09]MDZ7954981.1 hypothetical protein [Nostoc sp. DedQUE09]
MKKLDFYSALSTQHSALSYTSQIVNWRYVVISKIVDARGKAALGSSLRQSQTYPYIRSCLSGNAQLPSVSGIQAMVLYPYPGVTGRPPLPPLA